MVGIAKYLAVALLLPSVALSDSDGLFCSGKSYFALERRSFNSDGVHRLLIIPLSDEMGIGPEFTVELPNFQAHRMTCEDSQPRSDQNSRGSRRADDWHHRLVDVPPLAVQCQARRFSP